MPWTEAEGLPPLTQQSNWLLRWAQQAVGFYEHRGVTGAGIPRAGVGINPGAPIKLPPLPTAPTVPVADIDVGSNAPPPGQSAPIVPGYFPPNIHTGPTNPRGRKPRYPLPTWRTYQECLAQDPTDTGVLECAELWGEPTEFDIEDRNLDPPRLPDWRVPDADEEPDPDPYDYRTDRPPTSAFVAPLPSVEVAAAAARTVLGTILGGTISVLGGVFWPSRTADDDFPMPQPMPMPSGPLKRPRIKPKTPASVPVEPPPMGGQVKAPAPERTADPSPRERPAPVPTSLPSPSTFPSPFPMPTALPAPAPLPTPVPTGIPDWVLWTLPTLLTFVPGRPSPGLRRPGSRDVSPTPLTFPQPLGLGSPPRTGNDRCNCPKPKRKRKRSCTNKVVSRRVTSAGGKRYSITKRWLKCPASSRKKRRSLLAR